MPVTMYIIIAFQGIEIEEIMKPHTGEIVQNIIRKCKIPDP